MERHHHNHHITSYQRCWFILKGNLLFYFEERDSCDPLGLIVLEGCTVELCEATEEFAFAIRFDSSGGKSYVLIADCQVAMEAWVKALSRASFDYMRLVVKELEKQLEEAQRSLAASHKSPKKLSSGRKRHLSNPMMISIQEHPVILENGYSTWNDSCTLAEMAYSDFSGGFLKPPPLPPRRKLTGSAVVPVIKKVSDSWGRSWLEEMASRLWSVAGSWVKLRPVENQKAPLATVLSSRNITVTRTGAILPKPVKMPFGLVRVFAVRMTMMTTNRSTMWQ
ncbi:sesquipedalian-2 [Crotalus adamanteus]|uniref:Multifunctional fusion protein n=1 Tax=Crotalus adamanteus TaxID=8729 RepID=A0AAW1BD94_CROAD